MARKRMAMATGSLKSRRTKMEWMRYEAQHMKKKTYGGTLQGTKTHKGHQQPALDSVLPLSSSKPQP